PESENLPLIISVAFWSTPRADFKSIPINDLDFFVVISRDRKMWKIWRGGNLNIFKLLEGDTKLEETYTVSRK
ncbi:unnamed protein product, partial [marine sediment metagenome]